MARTGMVRAESKENPLNTNISAAPVVTVGSVKFGNDLPLSIISLKRCKSSRVCWAGLLKIFANVSPTGPIGAW